jgi:hypothetical protein
VGKKEIKRKGLEKYRKTYREGKEMERDRR